MKGRGLRGPQLLFLLLFALPLPSTGCPIGYTPATDSLGGTRACVLATDCGPGAECRWTPYSAQMMCCRYAPGSASVTPRFGFPPPGPVPGSTPWYIAPPRQQPPVVPVQPVIVPSVTAAPPPVAQTQPAPQPQPAATTATLLPTTQFRAAPLVSPVIVGRWQAQDAAITTRFSSVTLIQDNGYNILVDTSVTARSNEINTYLARRGTFCNSIHLLVLTQGNPDHLGNLMLFPNAQIIYSTFIQKGEQFLTSGLSDSPMIRLTENTDLWKTPGPTRESLTLVVKNVQTQGTVAITGDLFLNSADSALWPTVSYDLGEQQQNRNLITCMANWIVPGHGPMFAVTVEMKTQAGCPTTQPGMPTPPAPSPAPIPPTPAPTPPPPSPAPPPPTQPPTSPPTLPPTPAPVAPTEAPPPPAPSPAPAPPGPPPGPNPGPPVPPDSGGEVASTPPPASRTLVQYRGRNFYYYLDPATGYVISVPINKVDSNKNP